MKLRFHSDAGHGWLRVPLSELDRLGIRHLISQYSYRNATHAFLEEDCDAAVYVAAVRGAGEPGLEYVQVDDGASSRIRSYPRFPQPQPKRSLT